MNQFRNFISQYASNAVERVACHYKECSLTFRIVASRALSRAPSSRLNPTCRSQHLPRESQNGNTSAKSVLSLSSRRPILWSQCNVQYRPSPVVPTVAGHRMFLCKGKSPGRPWTSEDWALYWQLFETLNYALCNGMWLFPQRCLCTVKQSFKIGSFFMKDPVYYLPIPFLYVFVSKSVL
jgi:hypothetical protein